MLHPLDEFPVHQTPLPMSQVGTSDKNFYDRCYFNAHDRTGDVFVITGLGTYANLGVVDAYATVKLGDTVHTARFSDALGPDRMHQHVGPYRIEILEPLQRVRVVCDGDDHGVGFDLTWDGSFPAVEEEPHVISNGYRTILQSSRFAQMGSWTGEVRVDGTTIAVEPTTWLGSRDRSWGIRPVGDADSPGRTADDAAAGGGGFWWLYVPLRFDEFQIIVMAQEQADGYRTLNDAKRVWADGRIEQLGWPVYDIRYRSGSRHPEHATLHLQDMRGKPVTVEIDTLGFVPLQMGPGYGDAEWAHGQWKGADWAESVVVDLADPAVVPRIPFGNIDHVAHASCDGAEGWGLFEHASIGAHAPTGFTDLTSVAP
jgi:hypothetical protein